MFDLVLYEPEIPPNTGSALRLAANTGARVHLVRPLGFSLSDRRLARAGLDYAARVALRVHPDWPACRAHLGERRVLALTTRGAVRYDRVGFQPIDVLLFGSESRGLPQAVLNQIPATQRIRLPMLEGSRSLNLANAIAIVLYEAWRQNGFAGAAPGLDHTL